MAHIHKSIVVPAPPAAIRGMVLDPERWAEWYVGLSAPTKLDGSGEAGTYSEHTYQLAGHGYPIHHTVSEVEDDGSSLRWKGTIEGSFRGWHEWIYRPVAGGTEVTVDHHYDLPGRMLGRIVDAVVVERLIARNLDASLETLRILGEGSHAKAA